MPELPEVETIRTQLTPSVEGRRIERLDILDQRLTEPRSSASLRREVEGKRIVRLSRRGKYLRFELDDGSVLVLHLRMTGVLTLIDEKGGSDHGNMAGGHLSGSNSADPKYLRMVIDLDDGKRIAFNDMRRFGTLTLLKPVEDDDFWLKLGPEPLERGFNSAKMKKICENRNKAIKSTLMDQKLIAGVGNIYADESLFRSGIHPERRSAELSGKEVELLTREIKKTLREAIRLQGSSINTYADTDGNRGRFQETFMVHRREGEPCPACGKSVRKIKVGGRGTYFCPRCQV